MTRRKKVWMFARQPKPKVPESIKAEVERKCNEFVESVLKPEYIKRPEDERFNYVVDIFTKWYRNYFYFCAKYYSPHSLSFFEEKFARLEYAGNGRFNLSYMRHTGKWMEIFEGLSLDECLEAIEDMPHFTP